MDERSDRAIAVLAAAVLGTLVWLSRSVAPTGDLFVAGQGAGLMPSNTRFRWVIFRSYGQRICGASLAGNRRRLVLGIGFLVAFRFRRQRQHELATGATVVSMARCSYAPTSRRAILIRFSPRECWQMRSSAGGSLRRESSSMESIRGLVDRLLYKSADSTPEWTGHRSGIRSRYPDAPPVFLETQTLAPVEERRSNLPFHRRLQEGIPA
jgi:hypothetical protein